MFPSSVRFVRQRRRYRALALALFLALTTFVAQPSPSMSALAACEDGLQASGATYRICMPDANWNGDLLVYAHGYVSPTRSLGIPEDQMTLPGIPFSVDQIATSQGYGFVTSGYAVNGLAVRQGLADLTDAVEIFEGKHGKARRVIIVGASEGGLVATLAVEERADLFDGALALCGVYGDYAGQADYIGDFRVLFDYYFPSLLPPTAVNIPQDLLDSWDDVYYPQTVQPEITAPENGVKLAELLTVASVAHDAEEASGWDEIIERLLWYNVHASNDAAVKLGGQPFENQGRQYSGSGNDVALNQNVARFGADAAARAAIAANYETAGNIQRPLVTLHTIMDPLAPYWHAQRLREKVEEKGRTALYLHVDVEALGHCAFSSSDVLGAFNKLIDMVEDQQQMIYLPAILY